MTSKDEANDFETLLQKESIRTARGWASYLVGLGFVKAVTHQGRGIEITGTTVREDTKRDDN
jgi:hypothetical protein